MDLLKHCRLCFNPLGNEGTDLFVPTQGTISNNTIVEECLSIPLQDPPEWPSSACDNCILILKNIQKFKSQIFNTQTKLNIEIPDEKTSFCRLCLIVFGQDGINIFRETVNDVIYSNDILECFSLPLTNQPNWPTDSCMSCITYLSEVKAFRSKVLLTQSLLSTNGWNEELTRNVSSSAPAVPIPEPTPVSGIPCRTSRPFLLLKYDDSDTLKTHDSVEDPLGDIHDSDILKTEDSIEDPLEDIPDVSELKPIHPKKEIETEGKESNEIIIPEKRTRKSRIVQKEKHLEEPESIGRAKNLKKSMKPTKKMESDAKVENASDKLIRNHEELLQEKHLDKPEFIEMATNLNMTKCRICDVTLETLVLLSLHMIRDHNLHIRETFTYCQCSEEKLIIQKDAKHHLDYHKDESIWKCEDCSEIFITKTILGKHRFMKCKSKWACPKCGKTGRTAALQAKHVLEHDMNPFMCENKNCRKLFETEDDLKAHKETGHDIVCHICGTEFGEKWRLQMHLRTHKNSQNIAARRKNGETIGMSTFNQCDICGKYVSNVNAHRKTHATIRPKWTCPECGKTILDNKKCIQVHLENHEPAKFICPTCGYKCKQSNNFKRHMKRHDKVENPPKVNHKKKSTKKMDSSSESSD